MKVPRFAKWFAALPALNQPRRLRFLAALLPAGGMHRPALRDFSHCTMDRMHILQDASSFLTKNHGLGLARHVPCIRRLDNIPSLERCTKDTHASAPKGGTYSTISRLQIIITKMQIPWFLAIFLRCTKDFIWQLELFLQVHCAAKAFPYSNVKCFLKKKAAINTPLYNICKFKFLVVDKNAAKVIPLLDWKLCMSRFAFATSRRSPMRHLIEAKRFVECRS